jgi:asparagine synthase (glutamine-hydrolysing)
MTATVAHRGPDAEGYGSTPIASLGHRRLSIIDLTDQANQPMEDPSGRWSLVYNGEVYNYLELRPELESAGWRFRTHSDTEVVLAALAMWGPDAVSRFNGMWALALVDGKDRSLILSRDRFGVKPLFFHVRKDGGVIFGSEVKALLAAEPSLASVDDVQVARFLFLSGLGEGRRSLYQGVDRLLPAHNMVVDAAGTRLRPYWGYPAQSDHPIPFEEAKDTFIELLADAVRLRLRSDVPVATTLSGGIDSGAVAALVHAQGITEHTTYTASFPGSWFDEGARADAFSRSLGFRSVLVSEHLESLDLELFSQIVAHMDGPTLNPATIPLWEIMRNVRSHGTKVVLDGQGADELLGGYTNQVAPYSVLDALTSGGSKAALMDLRGFARWWGTKDVVTWFTYTQAPWIHRAYQRLLGIRKLAGPRLDGVDEGSLTVPIEGAGGRLNGRLRWQHVVGLRPLLEYGDRISMAHGVESRQPFMDYRLVEFVSELPGTYKVRHGKGKILEREALRGILPDGTLEEKKLGFVTPVRSWFGGAAGEPLLDRLAHGAAAREGYVDPRALERVRGRRPSPAGANALFRLLGLEIWLEHLRSSPKGESRRA